MKNYFSDAITGLNDFLSIVQLFVVEVNRTELQTTAGTVTSGGKNKNTT